jgi:GntR family transcriptional regulator
VSCCLPEPELEKKYNVSRITIRKAMNLLANDGYVFIKQGFGTIVAFPSMQKPSYVTSFTESIRVAGYTPSTKNIHISHVIPDSEIGERMGVGSNEEFVCIQRLVLADDVPIGIMTNYILSDLVPGIDKLDLDFVSLYYFLERHYNISINASRDYITARTADLTQAVALDVPVGTPLIYLKRISFSNGHPVLFDVAYINGYKHVFSFNLIGKAPHLNNINPTYPSEEISGN